MTKQLVLASNNRGKIAEFSQLLAHLDIEVLSQSQFQVSAVDEPYHTFLENALQKARHASQQTGLPALADDSGIVVPALGGAPGVLSARYASLFSQEPSDEQNNRCLIEQMRQCTDRSAYYIAVLVLLRSPQDPMPLVAQGVWQGQIVDEPKGQFGFGYDPHFYIPELACTAAELTPELKNQYSHRAKALACLIEALRAYPI